MADESDTGGRRNNGLAVFIGTIFCGVLLASSFIVVNLASAALISGPAESSDRGWRVAAIDRLLASGRIDRLRTAAVGQEVPSYVAADRAGSHSGVEVGQIVPVIPAN